MEFILLGAACLLARAGLALYATGLVRSKNAAGAVTRTLCDLCVATLAFWAVGASVFQSHRPFIGLRTDLLPGAAGGASDVFFFMTVILIGTGVVSGAMAERSKFFPLCGASVLLAAVVIPVAGNWAREGGWLGRRGFIDAAGASWLHVTAAACAAAGAIAVGARTGKYNRDGSASMIPGHNVPLASAGALMMLAGWMPYIVGCAALGDFSFTSAERAATNTLLAAAAAGAAGLLVGHYRYGKPDIILTLMALLGGLVAISAGAARFGTPAAVLTGAVAGVLVPLAAVSIDLRFHVDDPAGAIAVHGVGGAWGTLAVGLFVHGSVAARARLLGIQVIGLAAVLALSVALSVGLFALLKASVGLRSKEADEFDGLDLAEHDIAAYPDFQQTMIKSYHLREA